MGGMVPLCLGQKFILKSNKKTEEKVFEKAESISVVSYFIIFAHWKE